MSRFFVIDAMNLAHRCYHVFKDLSTKSGFPTGTVYGASSFMFNLINGQKPDYLVVATDTKEPTFRHEMYSEYKANRPDKDNNFLRQLPVLYKMWENMGIPVIKMPGYEADDIIGSLAAQQAQDDRQIYIVSSDKDFMQCVNKNVFIYKPLKWPNFELVDANRTLEKIGVTPSQMVDYLAITGDVSDNVPGVKGIGAKGAAKLLGEFHSLEGIYNNIGTIKGKNKDKLEMCKGEAYMSKNLVQINLKLDLTLNIDDAKLDANALTNDKLKDFYKKLEFKSFEDAMNV